MFFYKPGMDLDISFLRLCKGAPMPVPYNTKCLYGIGSLFFWAATQGRPYRNIRRINHLSL